MLVCVNGDKQVCLEQFVYVYSNIVSFKLVASSRDQHWLKNTVKAYSGLSMPRKVEELKEFHSSGKEIHKICMLLIYAVLV